MLSELPNVEGKIMTHFYLLTAIHLSVLENSLQQVNPIFSSTTLLIYN